MKRIIKSIMTKCLMILGILTISVISVKAENKSEEKFYTVKSSFNAKKTIEKIEEILKDKKIEVFARIDHKKNAEDVKMELRESYVILFGSPKAGTPLMVQDQKLALELPLKILVWEDSNKVTWVRYRKMANISSDYSVANHPIVKKMDELAKNIVDKSSGL